MEMERNSKKYEMSMYSLLENTFPHLVQYIIKFIILFKTFLVVLRFVKICTQSSAATAVRDL